MSNDRNHDEQVSAAYRNLASERTPEHLDQKVLRMARANAERPRYSRWLVWSRPLAWAATVALCLAITLEVTQVMAPNDMATETTPTEVAAPAATIVPEIQKDKREQLVEQDMDQQPKFSDSIADSIADSMADSVGESISAEKITPARGAAKQVANDPAPAGRMRLSADMAEAESIEEVVAPPAADFEVKAASELRREDESAYARYAATPALTADMPENECSEDIRLDPETWLECIEELEAAGDKEAALQQRKNLEETFPDFKLP